MTVFSHFIELCLSKNQFSLMYACSQYYMIHLIIVYTTQPFQSIKCFCESFVCQFSQGFSLEFHFEPNEYFTDTVLTKRYEMRYEPDPEDPLSYEGPEIVKCTG